VLSEQRKFSELLFEVLIVRRVPGVSVFFYFSFGWSKVQQRLKGRLR
jgi:hypothetical protein